MSESCFTPEQEARIAAIVRDTLNALEHERLGAVVSRLERFVRTSSATPPPERLQRIVLDAAEIIVTSPIRFEPPKP